MSYCRFGWDGSDVYVFTSSSAIECCGCALHKYEDHSDPNAEGLAALAGMMTQIPDDIPDRFGGPNANQDMIEHLRLHQAAGHHVPDDVFERLTDVEDALENQRIFEKYGRKRDEEEKGEEEAP